MLPALKIPTRFSHLPLALLCGLTATLATTWMMAELIAPTEKQIQTIQLDSIKFVDVVQRSNQNKSAQSSANASLPDQNIEEPPPIESVITNSLTTNRTISPVFDIPSPIALSAAPKLPSLTFNPDASARIPESSTAVKSHSATSHALEFDEALYPLVTAKPVYPRKARRQQIEGKVNVAFTITIQGKVENIEILNAQPQGIFEQSTLQALSGWQFQPQLLNGVPAERRVIQTIHFELNN